MTGRSARSHPEKPGPAEAGRLPRRRRGRKRAAAPDPRPCPYLYEAGAGTSSTPAALAGATSGARCRAGDEPIRVGEAYLASVCRTPDYRSCPRFVDDAEPPAMAASGRRRLARSGIPSIVAVRDRPPEPARAAHLGKTKRRFSAVEVIVLGLAVCILLACVFVGYAVTYRLQMRGGIEVAAALGSTPASAVQLRPTLVPTFTPVPLPTPRPQATATVPALTSPRPEPTLAPPTPTTVVRPPAASPPTRIVIPKIDLDVAVLPVGLRIATVAGQERVVWSDVPRAAAFHGTSAYPGNPGNTVINGHRDILGSVFRHLDRLEAGDQVILYVDDVPYPYFVTETLVVPETFASAAQRAENAKLIGYFPEERLTLVTCTPVGLATHRLVVIAKPLARVAPRLPDAARGTGP